MTNFRIHYLQHVPFEGIGFIETWVRENDHILTSTKFYENEVLPALEDIDWLIVMGGPMSIDDEDQYPWLKEEKDFIRKAIDGGKVVIGICLGAQLIAHVLGAIVFPNDKKEIGWYPVDFWGKAGSLPPFENFPDAPTVLHWHGDTFEIPEGALHLMKSDVCVNQAFLYGTTVLALQFHLEATPNTLEAMVENCRDELVPGEFIQTNQDILAGEKFCSQTNALMRKILDYFQAMK
ncbi:MAG: type 1 glutamine amidotransferase [Bacteroidota bacterium]